MAHNIFNERFFSYREQPWHKLGIVSAEPKTAMQIAKENPNMLYDVEIWPSVYMSPDGQHKIDAAGYVAVVRKPTADDPEHRVFGIAKNGFQVIPPQAVYEMWDRVFPNVETLGVLGKGETIFITWKEQMMDIMGDEVQNYVLFKNTYVPGESLQIMLTPVRVVCQNTLCMAMNRNVLSQTIAHDTTDLAASAQSFLYGMKQILDKKLAATKENLMLLASKKVSMEQAREILEGVYRDDLIVDAEASEGDDEFIADLVKKSIKRKQDDAKKKANRIENILAVFQQGTGMDHKSCNGTAYGLYNAAVEYIDYGTFAITGGKSMKGVELFGWKALEKEKIHAAITEWCN